jgi:short-subunit dehydrogenase
MNIVITGATQGIGKAIAEAFAQEGNTLLIGSRTELDLKNLAHNLSTKKCTVQYFCFDASSKDDCIAFANWCKATCSTVDILVNNVGYFLPGSIHNEEDGTLEKMIHTNLYSAYYITRVLVPSMIANKRGQIYNICSIASLQAYSNGGSYSISKYALHGFSKNLREELKPHGVKVCSVFPGAVYTNSWSGSGVLPERIMESADVAKMIYAASQLSPQAVLEDIILRPQLGDV